MLDLDAKFETIFFHHFCQIILKSFFVMENEEKQAMMALQEMAVFNG